MVSPVLLLVLASSLAAQHDSEYAGHHGEPSVAASGFQVLHEEEHQDLVMLMGPVRLPAQGHSMRLTPARAVVVPVDGWLTRFRTRVVDTNGAELPSEILHHINLVRPGRRELFMPVMQRLAAAGQETGEIAVPFPFGIPVSRGDTILVVAMVHNPTGRPLSVTVEGRLHYDTPEWLNRVDVQPFYMDIRPPPEGAAFDLPPGRSTFSWEGSPAIDAELLGLGAHMHAHAVEVRLEELRPGAEDRVLWRATPVFRPDGSVGEIPRKRFLLRLGLGLSRDKTYRIVAVYDNPTGDTIPAGGMAELAGVAMPDEPWPAADRTSDKYVADYRSFTRHNPELQMLAAATSPDATEPGAVREDGHH
ncbi:MAG: hypothetical protein R3314_02965 [Longimicrobiales bacterium]|nr:hypothetical protein [Longimicrobiales bacterium]